MPRKLLLTVEDDDTGCGRRAWVTALAQIVAELARRWSLDVGSPFQPGGSTSWVAPAWTAAGARVVLKVGWRHDEALHEADGLRAWGGAGAVRLLDARMFDQTSALLLEACAPGTPLSDRPEPEQDPGVVRAGIEQFRELPRTAERHVLLCTDLHAANVLAAEREPWLAIDPKPYVGDPTYDVLQHMLNCTEHLAADPAGFARRMAGLLDLDVQRLCRWLFARCVLESLDDPELRPVATALAA